ncbi:MAG: type II secretion system GspH family protein [Acidobacteria bacterium]|nr:type II secretion system GspH family protein [Acidobacteriota bacterium]MCA1637185.1 type II secretion system GspH family protein [Acidobacteriota bacterium]
MNTKTQITNRKSQIANGFTLLELIVTLTVLAILVMGTIPLSQNAVKRQKEMRLRENLRTIRSAIDEFHRDTVGACPQGAVTSGNPIPLPGGMGGNSVSADPRSRVVIDDCKIFDTENLDRYPPSLEILVEGVRVRQRGINAQTNGAFSDKNATELNEEKEISKVYLRELPVDPMTGEAVWQLRSSYQPADAGSWDEINVFDVRSTSEQEALNGEKYSDW